MPNKRADPLADVAAQVVADDPQIRRRMKRIVNALLSSAEHTLQWGTPQEKALLMKQVVPGLLRSMQGADVNASEAEEAARYERIKAFSRGEIDEI